MQVNQGDYPLACTFNALIIMQCKMMKSQAKCQMMRNSERTAYPVGYYATTTSCFFAMILKLMFKVYKKEM